jgi:hypothetical protein
MFMNSPNVRQYATAFAQRLITEVGVGKEKVVTAGYRAALGREPDDGELEATITFLESQKAAYQQAKQANPGRLALIDFAQTLFSLNEFSYLR